MLKRLYKEPTDWVKHSYQFFCPDCGFLNFKASEEFDEYDISTNRNIPLYKTICSSCNKSVILPAKHIIFRRDYVTPKEIAKTISL